MASFIRTFVGKNTIDYDVLFRHQDDRIIVEIVKENGNIFTNNLKFLDDDECNEKMFLVFQHFVENLRYNNCTIEKVISREFNIVSYIIYLEDESTVFDCQCELNRHHLDTDEKTYYISFNSKLNNIKDVLKLIKHDKSHRYKGISTDLLILDNLPKLPWVLKIPTIFSNNRYLDYFIKYDNILIKEQDIIARLHERQPIIHCLNMDNIFIAGGCVSNAIISRSDFSDIDLFIYGLSKHDATLKVLEIAETIKDLKENKEVESAHYIKGKKNLTIMVYFHGIYQKLQIIFRLYKTKSEILHGFDLGSSAVGFDGEHIYATTLSAYSYLYRINIIDTTKRSTTYEKRLIKYFYRGFNIVMPHFDIKKFMEVSRHSGSKIPLNSYMMIKLLLDPRDVSDHEMNVILAASLKSTNNKKSDYCSNTDIMITSDDFDELLVRLRNDKFINLLKCENMDEEIIKLIKEKIEENKIKWIDDNPGRQITASFNPIIEDESRWYEDYYLNKVN